MDSSKSLRKITKGWQNDLDKYGRCYSNSFQSHSDHRRNGGYPGLRKLGSGNSSTITVIWRPGFIPGGYCKNRYGLAANHAFLDGNKRIGAMVVQLLPKWNGYTILLQDGELADTFIAIADGTMKEKELSDWIRIHLQ